MKIRSDFVSNSSSSSFIILHRDNEYGMLLDHYVEHYSLHDFIETFGEHEFLGYTLPYDTKMKFVTNAEFIKLFESSSGEGKYLPKNCIEDYADLLNLDSKRTAVYEANPKISYDDPKIKTIDDAENIRKNKIYDKIEKILKKYKNEIFDYSNVSDHDIHEDINGEYYSLEDSTYKRITEWKKHNKKFKFFRYINMH